MTNEEHTELMRQIERQEYINQHGIGQVIIIENQERMIELLKSIDEWLEADMRGS